MRKEAVVPERCQTIAVMEYLKAWGEENLGK